MGRLLENCGIRLQRSVFMVRLSAGGKKRLEAIARDKLEDGDSLLILPCCAACLDKARLAERATPERISIFI